MSIREDYTEQGMTVKQLAEKYCPGTKTGGTKHICKILRDAGLLRKRGRKPTKTLYGMRRCAKCKEEKPLEEFYADRTKSQGRKYVCKACA